MNSRRAHTARIGIVALAAVAFLLAFAIPRSNRTAGVPAGARSVGLQTDIAGLPISSGQVPPAANSGFLNPKSPIQNPKLVESYGRLPLSFEANRGQTDGQVKFLSRGRGYTMFLTQGEAVLSLKKPSAVSNQLSALRKGMALAMPSAGPPSSRVLAPEALLTRPTDAFFPPLIQNPKSQIQNPPAPSTQHLEPAVLRMKLVGANPKAKVRGLDELPGKSNYFLGNDPKKWRTNVPNYARVKYEGVYAGIDLLYYGNQGRLEYDFVVSPGADPRAIALSIDGADKMEIDAQGDLVLRAESGDVRLHKPLVYQPSPSLGSFNPKSKITNPKFLNARFVLRSSSIDNRQSSIGNSKFEVAFEIASYDPTKPLVIDPVLRYSTYLGGSVGDAANAVAVDADGNAYVTGTTVSIDFPTANAYQANCSWADDCRDVFVTKLNAAGSSPVYSTYVGGGGYSLGLEIAVDSSGNAYVTGHTSSRHFPTLNAFQTTRNGFWDAFVFKLDPTGAALLYSTFLGGSGNEAAWDGKSAAIAVDSAGNAYVTGTTDTADFPTKNAIQSYAGGTCGTPPDQTFPCPDAFVAKFNTNLSGADSLVYSTYLGGSGSDKGYDIAVDPVGNAYVTGVTRSIDFPTTPGAFQTALTGDGAKGFVTKLDSMGSLVYSTFLGGDRGEKAEGIAVDAAGNAYITGGTNSTNFPTLNAFQPQLGGGWCILGLGFEYDCDDEFVTKLNPQGSGLVYSTYLGGSGGEHAPAIAVDSSGSVYVAGGTFITDDFPMADPIQGHYAGGMCGEGPDAYACFDATVSKLSPSGELVFSTYLGGTGDDGGSGIAVDPSGNIYVAGGTGSTDFPITTAAFQSTLRGGNDAFVVKIAPADNTPAGSGVNVTLTNAVSLTFDSVATSGTTGVTRTNTGPEPPAGFSLGHPPTYYELSTTAASSGSVQVCINYTGTNYGNESKLKLFHFEGGKWEDRTVSLDTTNDIICASVMSLSPFAVLEDRRIEAEGLKPPLADLTPEGLPVAMPGNAFKQGRTLPLRLGLFRDGVALSNADVSPPQIVALIRNGEALDLATMDVDAGQANDNGTLFRFSDGNWAYNLSTQGLSPGTYTITMQMPDGRRWNAGFVLR
jgi:hypothetical protein